MKPILTFGNEITPVGRVRTRRRALERMDAYLDELHDRGATDWIVQHAQSVDHIAATGGTARLVDFLKGKLDGLGRSLAEAPSRSGQLHDNANRVRAGLLC